MEKEIIYRFFSGTATVEQEKQLLDWIDESPANRDLFFAERRMFDAMLIHAKPCAPRKRLAHTLPRWSRELLKYAAMLAVMVTIGVMYTSRQNDKLLQSFNTITVPSGQHIDVTLPDGTKVCMNALSELKYPTFFVGRNRKVQLTGEAFFDVAHDKKHPFIVETYACDIEVLGTKFDVEARADKEYFSTSLIEGKVRVTDRNNPCLSVDLQPNEQVRLMGDRLVVAPLLSHDEFLWREGLIAFHDASLTELMGQFEKYYGVKIVLKRQNLSGKLFTGKIRIAEGIDHALRVLQHGATFTYKSNDTRDIIYIQ